MKTENKPIHILTLSGGKWDKIYESARRVYSEGGISPTIHTCGGGNTEIKVLTRRMFENEKYVKCKDFI